MIPYYKPSITDLEKKAIDDVLDSGWLTTGSQVKAFEEEFSTAHGCKYALAVNSATAGLHLAIMCSPYIECKIPNYTFQATFEAAFRAGKSIRLLPAGKELPKIKDDEPIKREGYNIDISENTYGTIVPVHVGGELCDMSRIGSTRQFIIEDCAHRFPGGDYQRG